MLGGGNAQGVESTPLSGDEFNDRVDQIPVQTFQR